MFLGNAAASCEDNILTLIHELFTGHFLPVKGDIFSFVLLNNTCTKRLRLARYRMLPALTSGAAPGKG